MKELNSPLSVERMLENDFFDKRYLNKSYKIEDIKTDLQKKIDKGLYGFRHHFNNKRPC